MGGLRAASSSALRDHGAGVGNLLTANGHLGTYNIIHGPHKIINVNISLLRLVKHLTHP